MRDHKFARVEWIRGTYGVPHGNSVSAWYFCQCGAVWHRGGCTGKRWHDFVRGDGCSYSGKVESLTREPHELEKDFLERIKEAEHKYNM